jgi:hypothetical protein
LGYAARRGRAGGAGGRTTRPAPLAGVEGRVIPLPGIDADSSPLAASTDCHRRSEVAEIPLSLSANSFGFVQF